VTCVATADLSTGSTPKQTITGGGDPDLGPVTGVHVLGMAVSVPAVPNVPVIGTCRPSVPSRRLAGFQLIC